MVPQGPDGQGRRCGPARGLTPGPARAGNFMAKTSKQQNPGPARSSATQAPDPSLPYWLRPDCGSCRALCCIAPAFDAAQGFGYDKPAHTPCINLADDCRCTIHDRLADSGYSGCAIFDCHGAGQRVTRALALDSDAKKMFEVFTRLCVLHELLALLSIARQRLPSPDIHSAIDTRLGEIEGLCRAELETPGSTDVGLLRKQIMTYLRGLESTPAAAALRTRRKPVK